MPSGQSTISQAMRLCAGLCWLTLGSGSALAIDDQPEPVWLVNPALPGENLPTSGRSLFDRLFSVVRHGQVYYDLPYPFAALLARLDSQLEPETGSTLPPAKRVLIPLGRSLQRSVAAPDFFAFPRVVVAADAPPSAVAALYLKDRLYIAYQEKSAVLEVISYNESAGRFEFQLVSDYRAGAAPRIAYANRLLCFACHQNGGPIFSRALWDETNANPQIAARLTASGEDFYGVPPERGVDVPYAIDSATRRANALALTQRLWREGCGDAGRRARRCRAGLFTAALRHALSGGRHGEQATGQSHDVAPALRAEAARLWPGGLAIAASDIPNRNPLPARGEFDGASQPPAYSDVPARFDPLTPRPPQVIWRADADDAIGRLIGGLAEFIAASDARRLATALAAGPAQSSVQGSPCRIESRATRWSVRCQPDAEGTGPQLAATLEMATGKAVGGRIERLAVPGRGMFNSVELSAVRRHSGEAFALRPEAPLHGADGNRLTRIAFRIRPNAPGEGQVLVEFREEFATVEQTVEALLDGADGAALFGPRPFPRQALFSALLTRLAAPRHSPCCKAAQRLADTPPPALEAAAVAPRNAIPAGLESAAKAFYPYCAACHQSAETFPPNFLSGNGEQVAARLRHCAPRLYVRLAMADLPAEQRDKSPMPPESVLPVFATDRAGWRASPERKALLARVDSWLRAESGLAPNLDRLLADGYEALRPCLPAP